MRHGELTHTRFLDQGPHDGSNRLASFMSILNQDFTLVEEFFDDKFWVDTFEKLCTSEALAGDAFAFEDLVSACREVFQQGGGTRILRSHPPQRGQPAAGPAADGAGAMWLRSTAAGLYPEMSALLLYCLILAQRSC